MTLYLILSGIVVAIVTVAVRLIYVSGKNSVINKQYENELKEVQDINKKAADASTDSIDVVKSGLQKFTRE